MTTAIGLKLILHMVMSMLVSNAKISSYFTLQCWYLLSTNLAQDPLKTECLPAVQTFTHHPEGMLQGNQLALVPWGSPESMPPRVWLDSSTVPGYTQSWVPMFTHCQPFMTRYVWQQCGLIIPPTHRQWHKWHCHDVTWVPRQIKAPTTQLLVQQLVTTKKPSKVPINGPLWRNPPVAGQWVCD